MVLVLASLGAARIDVLWVGKAGTFGLMFAYPTFLLGYGDAGGRSRSGSSRGSRASSAWPWPGSPPAATSPRPAGPCATAGRPDERGSVGMKAVIMAGGEGTRLRPQTSNLPKPMLPLVGRPMMEHIVSLLRRHGITDIVVTVAFLPNVDPQLLRRRQRARGAHGLRHRGVAARDGGLGAQRARAADRALLGHLGRRADRHRPHVGHRVPREEPGAGHHRALRGREPARVRHRDHPRGREHRALLGEARDGARSSATPSTPASTCSSPRSSSASPRAGAVDFSGEVFPAVLEAGEPLYGYVADGYWEDVGTTAAYLKAHEDILDGKVEVDVSGFELRPGRLGGQGHVDRPLGAHRVARLHRRELHHRPGRRGGRLHDHRRQHPGGRAGRAAALGDRRELLPRSGGPGRGGGARALVRPARRRPGRARGGGRRGLPDRQPTPRCAATSRSTPTRSSRRARR